MTELEKITNMIAKKTAQLVLPRVRLIVKEEIGNSFDQLIREMKKPKRSNQMMESTNPPKQMDSVRRDIAERQSSATRKAKQHMDNIYKGDFDVDDLIESAIDPQLHQEIQHNHVMTKPLTDITEVSEMNIDPATIDYSAMMKKLG